MKTTIRSKNIFADKSTLVLRKMILNPDKRWVVRDFTDRNALSLGMAQEVLNSMDKQGYVERIKRGPDSSTTLVNRKKLISDWTDEYNFDFNEADTYYTSDKDILKKIKIHLNKEKYALTLHSGANLITSFVRTDQVHLYLKSKTWERDVLEIRQKLNLKELVKGGNFHLVKPYYKNSVFFNTRIIKGYSVISGLQLYLDLYNFHPRGREHAEYLLKCLKSEGKNLG